MISTRQYEMGDLEFRAAPGAVNPWARVEFRAVFSGPNQQRLTLAGFYDGTDRWVIRFCLPTRGRWSYRTECRGLPTLDGQAGAVDVGAPSERTPLTRHGGLLKADAAHHSLADTDGTPFFWLGDTTGLLTATGGSRGSTGSTAGGGGRIAVAIGLNPQQRTELIGGSIPAKVQSLSSYDKFHGQTNVVGRTSSGVPSGGDGTVVWLWMQPASGTIFTFR